MSKSRRSSSASASPEALVCRLHWRPSRQLGPALWALALLAPFCVIASGLPRGWAWPLAVAALLAGLREAIRHPRQPPCDLLVPAGRAAASCDGARIELLRLRRRGPLAFLDWRDGNGRRRRLAFWPDTLGAGARRELELAMQRRQAASGPASMAG